MKVAPVGPRFGVVVSKPGVDLKDVRSLADQVRFGVGDFFRQRVAGSENTIGPMPDTCSACRSRGLMLWFEGMNGVSNA